MCVFLLLNALFNSLDPMSDRLLETSHQDDSNKWSTIGFGTNIRQVESIEGNFTQRIWALQPV